MKKANRNKIIFIFFSIVLLVIISLVVIFLLDKKNKLLIYNNSLIKIHRDNYGVPYIASNTDYGVLFGNGYVIAQDHLFQLEKNRRDAKGEIAEIYGSEYIDYDLATRNFSYSKEEALNQFNLLSKTDQSYFIAYRDGINAYINKILKNKERLMPPEFFDLNIEPKQWTIEDSVAIAQMILRNYAENGGEEINNLQKLKDLNYDIDSFNKLNPAINHDAVLSIPDSEIKNNKSHQTYKTTIDNHLSINFKPLLKSIKNNKNTQEQTREKLKLITKLGSFMAIVSPDKSTNGHAMIIAGPQMGSNKLQITSEIKLKSPNLKVAGVQIPGVPGVIIGMNNNISWTMTSGAWSDNVDTYIETLNPDNKLQYLFNGQWQDMIIKNEEIKIKDSTAINYQFAQTIHGPIIYWDLENNKAFTQKRSLWHNELNDIVSIININKSNNIEDFQNAIKNFSGSLNFGYADKKGDIGYFHMGKYPIRDWDPRFPAIGDGTNEWNGFIEYENMPIMINPQQQFIVNWNNKPIKNWPDQGEYTWIDTHEPKKIIDLLSGDQKISLQDMIDIPKKINDRGSYEQIVELSDPIQGVNILPPEQIKPTDKIETGDENPYSQKNMYNLFEYKTFNLWQ